MFNIQKIHFMISQWITSTLNDTGIVQNMMLRTNLNLLLTSYVDKELSCFQQFSLHGQCSQPETFHPDLRHVLWHSYPSLAIQCRNDLSEFTREKWYFYATTAREGLHVICIQGFGSTRINRQSRLLNKPKCFFFS